MSTREELIARGMLVVRRIAYRRARQLPPHIDRQDLIGAGHEGLLQAMQRHDPERDSSFEAFVAQRARGAMKDEARTTDDLLTRYGRGQASRIARATHELRHELERAPTDDEIAERAGVVLEALRTVPVLMVEADPDEISNPCDSTAPEASLLLREHLKLLAVALERLKPLKRYVLEQYYWHERTQFDIGIELGVTESRVCQMLSEATRQLRAALTGEPLPKNARVQCETGERIGCWTVLSFSRRGYTHALCRCQCGAVKENQLWQIRNTQPRGCNSCRWSRARCSRPELRLSRTSRQLERDAEIEQMYAEIEQHGHVLADAEAQ